MVQLNVPITADTNKTLDTNITVRRHRVLVTVAVSVDLGKLLMLIWENRNIFTISAIVNKWGKGSDK
jgi:hypothetical protein